MFLFYLLFRHRGTEYLKIRFKLLIENWVTWNFNSSFSDIQYLQRECFCTYEELILIAVTCWPFLKAYSVIKNHSKYDPLRSYLFLVIYQIQIYYFFCHYSLLHLQTWISTSWRHSWLLKPKSKVGSHLTKLLSFPNSGRAIRQKSERASWTRAAGTVGFGAWAGELMANHSQGTQLKYIPLLP